MSSRILVVLMVVAGLAAAAPTPAPKQLAIVKAAVRQYEDGPPLGANGNFMTGDTVFFSCQIQGYKVSEESAVRLTTRIEVLDPDGIPVVEPVEHAVDTPVSAEDKNWMPIERQSFQLPPLAFPGTYLLRVQVTDKLAQTSARSEITFPVRGRQVERSKTLLARNFRFLHSEADRDPLVTPIYHAGEALWARFEITGFQYGPKNREEVSYGIAILDGTGKQLYAQQEAALETGESFYPKRYIPGVLSLSLDAKVRPGEYTLVVTLRDAIGAQTQEDKHVFRVE